MKNSFICRSCWIVTDVKNLCGHFGGHLMCDKCCNKPYSEEDYRR